MPSWSIHKANLCSETAIAETCHELSRPLAFSSLWSCSAVQSAGIPQALAFEAEYIHHIFIKKFWNLMEIVPRCLYTMLPKNNNINNQLALVLAPSLL